MKKLVSVALSLLLALGLVACGGTPSSSAPASSGSAASQSTGSSTGSDSTPTPPAATLKVGLVLGTGGLGDKNFNDMSYEGMQMAEKDFGISFDYLESESPSDYLPNIRMMCEANEYDLIIGLGSDMGEAITEAATDFPEQKFSHIDSTLDGSAPNVSAVQTKWQEQTFLTGVLAGLGTLSDMEKANADNTIGVVLGMDNPALRKGVVGYMAGARYVNPDVQVLEGLVNSFNDPGKGKEIALSLYNQGADFVQHIAGASGLGVYNAAKEADGYAFSVGANAIYVEPDYIVANAARKVDEMVYNEIKAVQEGTWAAGLHVSGIKENSVGYDDTGTNVEIPADILAAIEDIRAKIASGELVPPESADELDAWVEANQYK